MITFEIIFIIGFGILLHYTYAWSAKNRLIGYFSVVNRSVWEQLKSIAVPMFVMILFDYSSFGNLNNYWFAKFISITLGLVVVAGVMYLCRALLGQKATLLYDIIAIALGVVYAVIMFNNVLEMIDLNMEILGTVGVGVLLIAFALLTQFPLKSGLFRDPDTKKYGFGLTKEDLEKRFQKIKIKRIKNNIAKKTTKSVKSSEATDKK